MDNEIELGKWREGHYSSEMIAAMVKEAFERGQASVIDALPSENECREYADTRADKYEKWKCESHKLIRVSALDACDWLRAKLQEKVGK